ncbi:MAG: DNA mismatch repair protein MutS [Oscillospiraceae bacterium]|nr:DNA mismatch repair protein MutS [Oscillospiraceae bacterium]
MKKPYKTIDIHGFEPSRAKRQLEFEINRAPHNAEKILVIHGCNRGTVLRDLVRTGLSCTRISEVMPCFANDGESTIYLKGKQ